MFPACEKLLNLPGGSTMQWAQGEVFCGWLQNYGEGYRVAFSGLQPSAVTMDLGKAR